MLKARQFHRFQNTFDSYLTIEKALLRSENDILAYHLIDSEIKKLMPDFSESSFRRYDGTLFTPDNDIVDFNKITFPGDYDPIIHLYGWQYNAGLGDDIVVLPTTNETASNSGFQPFHDFHGGPGNDAILGGNLMDHICGDSGDDNLYGGNASDFLHGGTGDDELDGGSGNDELNGLADNDRLNGGKGNDELFGGEGDDVIFGGSGDDLIYGDSNADQIFPEESELIGNDTLMGGSGNDHLMGGNGTDILIGGSGKDIFYFSHGSGTTENSLFADVITDFQDGVDLLKLLGDLKFSDLIIEDIGVDCLIYVKQTYEHLVLIQNAAGQIDINDFA